MTFFACSRQMCRSRRRGISALWLLLFLPLLVIALCLVVEIGNLWIARIELESAAESAALAAVKEWGDANGGDTLQARTVGQDFAAANSVRRMSVALDDNYDNTNTNPNDNEECSDDPNTPPVADLVFGAIDLTDTNNVIFDATEEPACGGGAVMFDATGQGNLSAENAWGIAFRATNDANINANLTITQIVIDVDPGNTGDARFEPGSTVLSTNMNPAVHDNSGGSQPDNVGLGGSPPTQVTLAIGGPNNDTLTITFAAGSFNPGDRFRFGADVRKRQGNGPNFSQASGDDIGQLSATVTVYFALSGTPIMPASTGSFFDNSTNPIDSSNQCFNPGLNVPDPIGQNHLVVHRREVLDLPCPATAAANNNGQSFGDIEGSGSGIFGVRAQHTKTVPTVCQNLLGVPIGPFAVSAKATAMYDCADREPKLVRIDTFICP